MAAGALEQELVQALRALELQDVAHESVTALFDTGGTGDDPQLRAQVAESSSLVALCEVANVFRKYLQQQQRRQQQGTANSPVDKTAPSSSARGGRNRKSNSSKKQQQQQEHDTGRSLWTFFASPEAHYAIVDDADDDGDSPSCAVYRRFFTWLHAVITGRQHDAKMDDERKKDALMKALVASNIYLSWLQVPGGAAYGLFMPYVYRQVLDVLKKWISDMATVKSSSSSSSGNNQASTANKKGRSKRLNQSYDTEQQFSKFGTELLEMIATFLSNFSLSSSNESILPTIEAMIFLQAVGVPNDDRTTTVVTDKSLKVLCALLSGSHGDILQLARVIIHCYVPGIAFKEMTAAENRSAVRFHKASIEAVATVHRLLASYAADSEDPDDMAYQISLLRLGIVQNLCLQAPDRSDERQRVITYAFSVAVGDAGPNTNKNDFQENERVRLVRFLTSYSRNAKAKYRQFAVELLGRFALESRFWKIDGEIEQDLEPFTGVGPLLDVLIDRASDKMSSVRAKAIAGISAALSLGLSRLSHANADPANSDDEDDKDESSESIAASLQEILYSQSIAEDGTKTMEETPLMQRLVDLFRESLVDDKTFVRKAAIQALEAVIIVGQTDTIHASMRNDLFEIQSRCVDPSVLVRVQAIKSLSSVIMKFSHDRDAQKLWSLGVLPLCVDPEASVQTCALEWTSKIIFDRILAWFNAKKNASLQQSLDSVWSLVSQLDGVMVRCAQKALRVLLKESKIDVKKFIRACVYAIRQSVNLAEAETSENSDHDTSVRFWSFSWIVLEELAQTGKLIEAAKGEQDNLSVVVECWTKLQERKLPISYHEGSKRILRVIAAVSTVINQREAKEMGDSILASLQAFAIPLGVIGDAVLALNSISKAKAPSLKKGREMSLEWGTKMLELCESNLRRCLESNPEEILEQTTFVQKQLISIGEVALLEFNKDEDKTRDFAGIALVSINSSLKSLVQLFLLPQIVSQNGSNRGPSDSTTQNTASTPIPTPVRVCAFVTLGKLCLRDQELAKSCITMMIRELRTCEVQDIRSNILLILGDLCIRYTALVDIYIPTIALSLLDASPLIRRSALLLFSQLILQDYIKWRESLLRFFLRAVVDKDEELSNLARHVLCGPLLQKSPHIFSSKFIEMIFVLNNFQGKVSYSEPLEREGISELALPGSARYAQRSQLYTFLLQNMTDEQKLQISMKLCNEILEEVTDNKLPLCANPSLITDHGTEAVLKDTFAILCSPDIKLSSANEGEDDLDGDEADGAGGNGNVAAQLAAAKGKLLSKMSKKNFLENIVPVLIGLKHTLESKHSPLMRYLLHYMRELFKLYPQEVKDVLSMDPQLAMEIEYDLRQFDAQQKQQEQVGHGLHASKSTAASSSGPLPNDEPSVNLPEPQVQAQANENAEPQESSRHSHLGPVEVRLRKKDKAKGAASKPPSGRRGRKKKNGGHDDTQPDAGGSDQEKESGESTLIFSPNKHLVSPADKQWQVAAQSPTVTKPSRKASISKAKKKVFTQEDLEKSMEQDLAGAFESAESPSKAAAAPHTSSNSSPVAEDEDDEVAKLPLKKKHKKKGKKVSPSSSESPARSTSKRKRRANQ